MSTYWDLYCIPCDATLEMGWHYGPDMLAQLGGELYDIASFEEPMNLLSTFVVNWGQFPTDLPKFADLHKGHEVTARNRYGELFGECARRVFCPCCGHHGSCKQNRGHAGECGPIALHADTERFVRDLIDAMPETLKRAVKFDHADMRVTAQALRQRYAIGRKPERGQS